MDIRPGTKLVGPDDTEVTIRSLIARGGFGQVFLGELSDETSVAVKTMLTAGLSDAEVEVLRNEAAHAVEIDNPNVVRVLHVHAGGADSTYPPYLVMEYVDGGNLRDVIDGHRSEGTLIPVDELQAMCLQIGSAMEAINAKIVHRDLKPENILLEAGPEGRLKITDFGLAKLADAATRSETFKGWGTRPYQSPEAFEGGPNTVAMDMYSAGVLFYELATLEWPVRPKQGDNSPLAWRNAHLLMPPPDIRSVRPDLPIRLAQLIMLMLEKDPKKRPTSWRGLSERLGDSVGDEKSFDVSGLVQKATSSYLEGTKQEAEARAKRQHREERSALLQQAFQEPARLLEELVKAYNAETEVGHLQYRADALLAAEVRSQSGHQRLQLTAQIIDDLDLRSDGIVRILAIARLEPRPQFKSEREALMNRESFGGMNLVYMVRDKRERFGEWLQFRFEMNPFSGKSTYPRWFPIDFGKLPRALQTLRAIGLYQHQRKQLNDEWFKALLMQML